MKNIIKILSKVAKRYSTNQILSFDQGHVLKTFQLMDKYGLVSRYFLSQELDLGEGSIKTLVKHLKLSGLVETSKAGMKMSDKGKKMFFKISSIMGSEINIPKCSINIGKYNHVILLKGQSSQIALGIEQRDQAIKSGALGATTLIFKKGKFLMPGARSDSLNSEPDIRKTLLEKLTPEENDVLIIGSANNKKMAEFGAKNAALITVT